ncbi:hypothetical protein OWV82_024126 [Melia azedarach]|uniref:Uncharacterized protein n=1 Tax=Melia azedarach TaxID=155640 RepID=A0ACC1WP95_MELAZ|nr:hypothetical protein OWV82_024126 [Melia azedarach]
MSAEASRQRGEHNDDRSSGAPGVCSGGAGGSRRPANPGGMQSFARLPAKRGTLFKTIVADIATAFSGNPPSTAGP